MPRSCSMRRRSPAFFQQVEGLLTQLKHRGLHLRSDRSDAC